MFSTISAHGKFEQTLGFIKNNITSPLEKAARLIQLAKKTSDDGNFSKIITEVFAINATPQDGYYVISDLQEVEPARNSAFEGIFNLLMDRQDYHTGHDFLTKVPSPKMRAKGYIHILKNIPEGAFFDKIIEKIKHLDAFCVDGKYLISDLQEVNISRQFAFKNVFQVLMKKESYEQAFSFLESSMLAPKDKSEALIQLGGVAQGLLLEKVIHAAETFSATPDKQGCYLVSDLQDATVARARLSSFFNEKKFNQMLNDLSRSERENSDETIHSTSTNSI